MNLESSQKRIAFGYDRYENRIVVNEGQAAAVKLIYAWYEQGKSLGEIKSLLEGMGLPSPQNKSSWGKQVLSNILSNYHYLGSDVYPALITEELFEAVQKIKSTKANQFSALPKANSGT